MDIKDGLYLFSEGEKFSVYGLYLHRIIELDTASAVELLIASMTVKEIISAKETPAKIFGGALNENELSLYKSVAIYGC